MASLDVACGLGADALYLAGQGFEVTAWDASIVAITRLQKEAEARALSLTTNCLEITPEAFTKARFDLVYVHRYLDRDIIPAIIQSLKPGGVLFYQTFIQNLCTKPSYETFITTSNCNCSPTRVLQRIKTTTINNGNSSHHNHHHHNANNIQHPPEVLLKNYQCLPKPPN